MPTEKDAELIRRLHQLQLWIWQPAAEEPKAESGAPEKDVLSDARAEAFFSERFAPETDSAAETQELHPLDRLASTHPIVRQAVLVAAALLVGALVAWAAWGYSA